LPTATLTPSSYVLGRFLRAKEKYITAKAASNTPPTIKIKVVTMLNSRRLDPIVSVLEATRPRATLSIGFCPLSRLLHCLQLITPRATS